MTDKRLLTCAKLVTGRKAVDVGTDHGYLAVYLLDESICDDVVACDINEMPLNAARKTAEKAGLLSRVQLVLSDGLDSVPKDGVTDVVMAGMGGELIAKLIGKCQWLKDAEHPVNLVLQPMSKSDVLRKWLYDNCFEVKKELGCSDGGFVYSVIQAEFIGRQPNYACDMHYLYGGRVSSDYPDGKAYLQHQAQRLRVAGNGMIKSGNKAKQGEKLLETADMLLR